MLHAGISHPSPYFYNLCNALKEINSEINIFINPDIPSYAPKEPSILHFHRLKRYYNSNDQTSAEEFIQTVEKAKIAGWKIAWTIHNFLPIDRNLSSTDLWAAQQFSTLGDIIFTHTESMKTNAEKLFSKKVINSSYGINKLDGIFDKSKISVPAEDYDAVFTFGGNITEYKCLPESITAFKKLKEESKDKRFKLILAGPPSQSVDVRRHIKGDSDILFYNSFIGESSWDALRKITDVFLLPYDLSLPAFKYGIFPSSVPQILSYKKPMIVPDCPEIKEFIPKEDMAIFYDYKNKNGLFESMQKGADPIKRGLIIGNLEKITYNPSWKNVAKVTIEGYKTILKDN